MVLFTNYTQNLSNFFYTQDDRQFIRFARTNKVEQRPLTVEGIFIQKFDGTKSEVQLLRDKFFSFVRYRK